MTVIEYLVHNILFINKLVFYTFTSCQSVPVIYSSSNIFICPSTGQCMQLQTSQTFTFYKNIITQPWQNIFKYSIIYSKIKSELNICSIL